MDSALIVYSFAEVLLSFLISVSNFLVIWIYIRTDTLRTITNTYIFSLAVTDFLAGTFGIPVTVYSVITRSPHSYLSCLSVHLILCVLCTISTFHLLAMAFDKYVSICCKRQLFLSTGRHSLAITLITLAWIMGTLIAIVPVVWITDIKQELKMFPGQCEFTGVVDYRYLVYVIFCSTIILPSFIVLFCYTSILRSIRLEERQVKFLLEQKERNRRMRRRRKLIRLLIIIVLAYGICWYPLYIINTFVFIFPEYKRSMGTVTLYAVVLSHISCVVNPIIYAYGMPGFKQALQNLFEIHFSIKTCANSCYIMKSESKSPNDSTEAKSNRSSVRSRPQSGNGCMLQSFSADKKWQFLFPVSSDKTSEIGTPPMAINIENETLQRCLTSTLCISSSLKS